MGILHFVHSSRIPWPLGLGGFFPSQSKGSKAAMILYPQAHNDRKQYPVHTYTQCAPTHNTNNKHMASHKSAWGESSAVTGTCVNTGCTQVLQLHPLPSLQWARIEVHLRGVHAPAMWVSGRCCETGRAVTGI